MSERRRGGLGRGLGALIPSSTSLEQEPASTIRAEMTTATDFKAAQVPSREEAVQSTKSGESTPTGGPTKNKATETSPGGTPATGGAGRAGRTKKRGGFLFAPTTETVEQSGPQTSEAQSSGSTSEGTTAASRPAVEAADASGALNAESEKKTRATDPGADTTESVSRETKSSDSAVDRADSASTASTGTRNTKSKASRPVDFFFQPGRSETEEEKAAENEISSSGINLDRLRVSKPKPTTRRKASGARTPQEAAPAPDSAARPSEGPSEAVEDKATPPSTRTEETSAVDAAQAPSEASAAVSREDMASSIDGPTAPVQDVSAELAQLQESDSWRAAAPQGREVSSSKKTPSAQTAAEDTDEMEGNSEGQELVDVPGARFAEIPVESIRPNSKQPRTHFNEEDMDELVHSIREIGILQPIVVRPDTQGDTDYELVMGERRWRATQLAGLESIPAIIRDTADDDLLRDALLENLHRSQLNPLEEGAAYQQLLNEFGCTQEELSLKIGRSRPQISNTIRLMKLPPVVQLKVAAGSLSAGHARALLGLKESAQMVELAQRIINEGLSVRATEEIVSQQDSLRGEDTKPSRVPETPRHERLDYLATSLADRLDTNVKITLGARKGKVQIEFASVEDLNRIMDIIAQG